MCLVAFALGINLNNLILVSSPTSGTHNFTYGLLILLQLPLHLFILTL